MQCFCSLHNTEVWAVQLQKETWESAGGKQEAEGKEEKVSAVELQDKLALFPEPLFNMTVAFPLQVYK